jgi:repressor LexA
MKKATFAELCGGRIRERRDELGLTRFQLAVAVGVQPMSIYRYETGRSAPSSEHLAALAEHLDTTTDYLTGRTAA